MAVKQEPPRDHTSFRVAAEEVVHIPARGRQENLDHDDFEETTYTVPRIICRRGIMFDGGFPESFCHVATFHMSGATPTDMYMTSSEIKWFTVLVGKSVLRSCCWVDGGLCEVVYRPGPHPLRSLLSDWLVDAV